MKTNHGNVQFRGPGQLSELMAGLDSTQIVNPVYWMLPGRHTGLESIAYQNVRSSQSYSARMRLAMMSAVGIELGKKYNELGSGMSSSLIQGKRLRVERSYRSYGPGVGSEEVEMWRLAGLYSVLVYWSMEGCGDDGGKM